MITFSQCTFFCVVSFISVRGNSEIWKTGKYLKRKGVSVLLNT